MLKHTVRHIRGRIEVVRHTEGVVGEDERTRLAITERNRGGSAVHSTNTVPVGVLGTGQAHVVVGVVVGVDGAVLGAEGGLVGKLGDLAALKVEILQSARCSPYPARAR